jgi:hypothetical protein
MSKVWSAIVDMVERNFVHEDSFILKYNNGEYLEDSIEEILKNSEDVTQYKVSETDAFESPGYDTGVVYAAWVETDGTLHTIDYQWESM